MVVYGIKTVGDARTAGRGLLVAATQEQWGLHPLPTTALGPHGKPCFPHAPHRQFNLSHSGPVAVCALDNRPVGIDVQTLRVPSERLLEEVCSMQERAWLERWGEGGFALLWALKESRCKWSGRGLVRPIRDISVPLPKAVPLAGAWTALPWEEWTFSLWGEQGWWVCVCGEGAPQAPIRWMEEDISVPLHRGLAK